MNIDPSKKAQEQEEQNQQTTTKATTTTTTVTTTATTTNNTVLALLISPSSPSSASTVSPTASSISKNSSTDEVDETTAEAEPSQSEANASKAPATNRGQDDEQRQLADEDDHRNNSTAVRQHEQRSGTESLGVECRAATTATMTLAVTDTATLLGQCIQENVTTELRTLDVEAAAIAHPSGLGDGGSVMEGAADRESDSAKDDDTLSSLMQPVHELTAEALSPKTPQPLSSSSSSSSSTTSTPSVGEERRLPVVPEEDAYAEDTTPAGEQCYHQQPLASNNNKLEGDLTPSADSGGSGCINDRFNNNSKRSDSDFQTVGDSTQTKVSDRTDDDDDNDDGEPATSLSSASGHTVVVVGPLLEEGVPTSGATPATEIALGQGEQQRCAIGSCTVKIVPSDEHERRPVVSQPLLGKAERTEVAKTANDDNKCELSVAPIELVQTLPIETTDPTTTATRHGGLMTVVGGVITAAGVTVAANETNEDSEGVVSLVGTDATVQTVESKTFASAEGSPPSSSISSTSSSSSTAPLSPPTSSVSSLSSSESSPEVLAETQQEPSGKGDGTQLVADNRPLCDSAPKGHYLEGERFSDAVLQRSQPSSPPCSDLRTTGVVPPSGTAVDEGAGIGEERTQTTTSTRLLTLAEELSQAAAVASSSPSSTSLAVSATPSSAVVDVLPKSAADTAAAVVSGSSRSASPVLHSSLKKSSKMGVPTGAAAATAKSENRRRVSFPKDAQLITGYLDPVNPWASISICETPELLELYRSSCRRHNTMPLKTVLEHLQSIDVTKGRVPLLSLKDQHLSYSGCEALEEIFKHVQYRCIDLSHSGLDDVTATVMFDIIEYYEAANELDISDNLQMSGKSWTACINMIKKSQELNVLVLRGPALSDYQANNLAKALNTSAIHTLKLEHCVLSQQPIASLCTILKRNKVLRELWLAHNQLSCEDALQIANLLRANFYIQLIDISNNMIGDKGVEHIVSAIVEQAVHFKDVQDKKRKSELSFSDLSSSLNSINSAKNYFPQRLRSSDSDTIARTAEADLNVSPSTLTLTPPVTPPSTPALPSCEMTTEEKVKKVASGRLETSNGNTDTTTTTTSITFAVEDAATVYTMQQPDNDETNPPLPPSPPTPQTPGAVAPTNVNLVELSTKHSVSLQTTSDREKLDMVARPVMMTAEEEALMNSSSAGATAGTATHPAALGESDESKTMSTSAETVQTDQQESTVVQANVDCVELLVSLDDSHSDSPVPQAPKKPRLAKQDSVLTEFEASLSTAMEIGDQREEEEKATNVSERVRTPEQQVTKEGARANMMEEDVPELCTDYDDDGSNLRISQENLFVDLGIPALSEEEQSETRSASVESSGDVFSPLAPPSKKDEFQLLIEKSQQKEKAPHAECAEVSLQGTGTSLGQRDAMLTGTETMAGVRERKSAISSDERSDPPSTKKKDRTQSSSSDSCAVEQGIQMVNVAIKDNVPLSRSLDSVGGDGDSDFESSSPFRTTAPSTFPNERSFSSESLNSETSIDSNDSKSSLKIHESKFAAKNGTLERQQSNVNRDTVGTEQTASNPCGLQVLVLWNNEITRNSARHFQRLLERTSTLDTLNVGSNQLCNSFVTGISGSLKANTTLTNLGLQGAHLSDKGVKTMAEIIEFGGNSSLQRIDLRHNNIQKGGLEALNEAMKSNKSLTRIDLDDTPRRIKDTSLDGVGSEYSRLVNNIRAQCERNKNPPEPSEPISTSVRRARANYLSSRKISLTCPSIKTSPSAIADKQHLLDPNGGCKKAATGGRLRSPLPSPIPSPIASPVPSPSRNRFHVSRVTDSTGGGSASSPSPSSTGSSPTLFFPSNSRFRVVTVAEPDLAGAKSANNPYRSSSTISLPMSKSSTSSFAVGTTGTGTASPTTINRRPVCSSAPTLSSFPSSPLSPLAAGVPVVGRTGIASQTPSPLLPPSYSSGSNSTFHTTMLSSPLITPAAGLMAGSSPTMPTLLPVPNTAMPLGVTQGTLLQQQQQQQLQYQPLPPPQIVPMLHQQQQPQNYHFVTTFGPGGNTTVPLQLTHVQNYTTEPLLSSTLQPQIVHQTTYVQQQQQIPPQQTPSGTGKVRQHASESANQHSSSNNSSTLHDSVLSSTSIESPDLEVKRFMSGGVMLDDSCCSSISSNSIDSIDNANFNINTSISSTDESFDLIVSSPPPVTATSTGCSGAIPSTVQLVLAARDGSSDSSNNVSSTSRVLEEESTLIPRVSVPNVSLPSGEALKGTLDASTSGSSMVHVNLASSQESLYDVHDLSGSSNSPSMSAAANYAHAAKLLPASLGASAVPAPSTAATGMAPLVGTNNSNESTLTSVQNLEREPTVTKVASEKPPRVRKTSWILGGSGGSGSNNKHTDSGSSGGSTPTPSGGSGYPPAIEKLLSIFNPSNLFSSNRSSVSASPPPAAAQEGVAHSGGSQPPSRKESPMGGLFHWAHHSTGSSNNTSANTSPTAAKKDDDRAVLKVNVSPETTLTPQQLQPLQNQVHLQTMAAGHHHQQQSVEHMPPQLKVEMKENISPENTITNKLLLSSNAAPVSAASLGGMDALSTVAIVSTPTVSVPLVGGVTQHTKVIFQLGGDYDELEDDIDTLTNKYGNHPSLGSGGVATGTGGGGTGIHYFGGVGGIQQSGPNSLLGGSTTSNSSGISIGSGTSAGDMMSGSSGMVVSPSPSATSGQSATSDTVVVLSHLGQIARDSLSMFKNPSLTSQDSISIRSMDSLTEIGSDSASGTGKTASMAAPPSSLLDVSTAGRKDVPAAVPTTSTRTSSSTSSTTTQISPSATAAPLADRQETR
ncbi:serine-rich adhesin for platelets [Anopheles funestus]|uniref:serine-rich adhesin for platelets n=1 Tax=Anopheles funestus TaxID=62324 RepID=UPI0020C6F1FC|nr:serine-rich adhesin for platelets [Anopheles funestus]